MAHSTRNLICHYHYDALDRLVGYKRRGLAEQTRYYCGTHLATEIQETTSLSTVQQGGLFLAQRTQNSGVIDSTLLSSDQQRSVLHALHAEKPMALFTYTPYGHREAESDFGSPIGFKGECSDSVTRHYPLGQGHRSYNPILMRFNSPDSLSPFNKGGLNPYVYCVGDPVNRTDPNGRFSFLTKLLNGLLGNAIEDTALKLFSRKPVMNFRNIAPDVSIFDDFYKGGKRLNVNAHGGITDDPGQTISFIAMNGKAVLADDLYAALKAKGVNLGEYSNVRLLACYAADGDISFASNFSKLSQKPVKAFSGTIRANPYPLGGAASPIGVVDESVKEFLFYKGFIPYGGSYQPRKFYPPPAEHSAIVTQPTSVNKIRRG